MSLGAAASPSPRYRPPAVATAKKTTAKSSVAPLIALYAIAVGITPEFDFLGIPKVRITDLLLPVIMLAGASARQDPSGKSSDDNLPLTGLFIFMFVWDLFCLLVWGKATFTPGFFYLAKRLMFFLVAHATFRAVRDVPSWNRIVRWMVYTSPLLSLSVLYELGRNIESGGILASAEGMRASGIIANQQTSTALYIAVVSAVALGAWDAFKDPMWRLGVLASVSTGCMAIFATGSRGGVGCIVLAVLCTIFQRPRQGCGLLILSAALGGLAWLVTPDELQGRLASVFEETAVTVTALTTEDGLLPSGGSSSVADRAYAARDVFNFVLPQGGWIVGLGTGFKKLGSIDNFYLSEWVFHGIIGLVIWLLLQLSVLVGLRRVIQSSTDSVEKGVAMGAMTAWVVVCFSGLSSDSFYLIRPMEAMCLLLGLVAARRTIRASSI